jgi:hypothetical protein
MGKLWEDSSIAHITLTISVPWLKNYKKMKRHHRLRSHLLACWQVIILMNKIIKDILRKNIFESVT